MAWAPWLFGAAAVSAVSSIIGGSQAASAAEDASRRQENLANQDMAFRQQMYAEQKALYGPLQQRLMAMANSDQPLNWSQISGQISNQYSDQVRQVTQMGGQGQYGGLKYDRLTKLGLANATGKVQAYNQGLLNRLNLGTALVSPGSQAVISTGQFVGSGLQGYSQQYGNQAAMFGQAAANAYASAGSTITNAALGYGMYSSDIRLKKDIEFLKYKDDIKLYKFKYKWSNDYYVGVLAQDLLGTKYASSISKVLGFYCVDYSKLGIEMLPFAEYSKIAA